MGKKYNLNEVVIDQNGKEVIEFSQTIFQDAVKLIDEFVLSNDDPMTTNSYKKKFTEVAQQITKITPAMLLNMYFVGGIKGETLPEIMLVGRLGYELAKTPEAIELSKNDLKIIEKRLPELNCKAFFKYELMKVLELLPTED